MLQLVTTKLNSLCTWSRWLCSYCIWGETRDCARPWAGLGHCFGKC